MEGIIIFKRFVHRLFLRRTICNFASMTLIHFDYAVIVCKVFVVRIDAILGDTILLKANNFKRRMMTSHIH